MSDVTRPHSPQTEGPPPGQTPVPSAAVPCEAVPCEAVPCEAVPCAAVPCEAVPGPPAARVDALLATAEPIRRSAPERALALVGEALTLARSAGDRGRIARCLSVLGHIFYARADYPVASEHFGEALAIALDDELPQTECEARLGLGFIGESTGQYVDAAAHLRRAIALARELGNGSHEGFGRNALGNVLAGVGDCGSAIEELERALEIFVADGESYGELMVRNNIGAVCLAINNPETALEQLTRALELSGGLDDPQTWIVSHVNVGNALERLGRTDEALEHYERSLALARENAAPNFEAYVMMSIGGAMSTGRDASAALEWFAGAIAIADTIGESTKWIALGSTGHAYLLLGRHEEAIAALTEALEHSESDADATYAPIYHHDLAASYEAIGDAAAALRHRRLEAATSETLAGIENQRRVMQLRMREQMAETLAERDRLAREAAELEARVVATTDELSAVASTLERRDAFIASLRREIEEVARELGGEPGTRVRAISERLRRGLDDDRSWQGFTAGFENVHPGFLRALATRWPSLTRMEMKICVLMRLELSSREMAELLFASPRTIHGHRFNIRRKLELSRDEDLGDALAAIAAGGRT